MEKYILIGFYDNLITSKRFESWKLLKALKPIDDIAWIIYLRDFNEILN